MRWHETPEVGGVSGTYTGEAGPGLLRQLQRNECARLGMVRCGGPGC